MTNLVPVSSFDNVPQLETSTLALGGPGGPINQPLQALLNRTQWLHDNAVASSAGPFAEGAGTANAQTASFAPPITTTPDGLMLRFTAAATNTGAATFAPNALAAKPILGRAHQALQGGELVAGGEAVVVWNSALDSWVLVASAGVAQVADGTQSHHAISKGQLDAFAAALATATGAQGIGFLQHGTGMSVRTLEQRLRDTLSVKDAGSVMDGTTNDTAHLNAALAEAGPLGEVYLPPGDLLVTSYSNPYGARVRGPGRVMVSITGGNQQVSSEADDSQLWFGQEYLYAFHNKLFSSSLTAKVVCSGDSTTFGTGTTAPWGFVQALASAGYSRGHYASYVNSGQAGKDTNDWVTTYLAGDLAQNPDLYVVRWGINDPIDGRTLQQYATSLRSGLATIRASKTLAQCSILIMVPNSTSDTPNGRDEKWYEQVRRVCRQAARDYQCALFDTYQGWKDARGAAGLWMDNPFADGRAIHPANLMNAWIASRMIDVLFPRLLRPRLANGTDYSKVVTDLPSTYPFGWSMYSTPSGDTTFPIKNAHVLTFKALNGMVTQWVFSGWASGVTNGVLNNGSINAAQIAQRSGQHIQGTADTWFDWTTRPALDITSLLVNGWVPFAAGTNVPYATKTGNVVTLHGLIKSGTTTAGTTLFTLGAGFRPRNTVEVFLQPTGPTGATTGVPVHVNSSGVVQIQAAANAAFLSLSGISFVADN